MNTVRKLPIPFIPLSLSFPVMAVQTMLSSRYMNGSMPHNIRQRLIILIIFLADFSFAWYNILYAKLTTKHWLAADVCGKFV